MKPLSVRPLSLSCQRKRPRVDLTGALSTVILLYYYFIFVLSVLLVLQLGGFDFDQLWLGLFGLGQGQRQHAVLQLGLNGLTVDVLT